MKKKIREIYETKVKILDENKNSNVMSVSVPFIQADEKNINGRTYPISLLKREVARVQGSVKRGSFIGTGDHPFSGLADIKTASHIVTSLSLDEKGQGTAELRILPTERGKTIQTLIRNNATLGVSIRGFGTIGKDGRVADDYKLSGLDVVLNPSFKDSVFNKSNIFESQNFEEEANDELEKQINELEKESWLSACDSGYKGTQEEWEAKYSGSLREMMGLPKAEGRTSDQELTASQISVRMHNFFVEAIHSGFVGTYAEFQEKFPAIVAMASQGKIVEKEDKSEAPFKSKTSWSEVVASGFVGTQKEFEEKYPDITVTKLAVQKPVVETLEQEAKRIFYELKKDNPNSALQLEDVEKMLEKEQKPKRERKTRELAIYRVNRSLDGSGAIPSQEILEKMIVREIESIKEEREEKKRKNWQAYKRLLD